MNISLRTKNSPRPKKPKNYSPLHIFLITLHRIWSISLNKKILKKWPKNNWPKPTTNSSWDSIAKTKSLTNSWHSSDIKGTCFTKGLPNSKYFHSNLGGPKGQRRHKTEKTAQSCRLNLKEIRLSCRKMPQKLRLRGFAHSTYKTKTLGFLQKSVLLSFPKQ